MLNVNEGAGAGGGAGSHGGDGNNRERPADVLLCRAQDIVMGGGGVGNGRMSLMWALFVRRLQAIWVQQCVKGWGLQNHMFETNVLEQGAEVPSGRGDFSTYAT